MRPFAIMDSAIRKYAHATLNSKLESTIEEGEVNLRSIASVPVKLPGRRRSSSVV